jgi:hypothetical protein
LNFGLRLKYETRAFVQDGKAIGNQRCAGMLAGVDAVWKGLFNDVYVDHGSPRLAA